MRVKKTKGGRFVFELNYVERHTLYGWLCSYLETESAKLIIAKLKTRDNLSELLEYTAINDLFLKHHSKIAHPLLLTQRFSFTRFDAIVLLGFLCDCQPKDGLLDVKGDLHKLLL